ncbi:rhoGAP-domain-containing protein [Mucor ambiguus]|uniref:RhoGAP-domain-containing protein n=1 Tax=Mucor ambiguus TaxID=91626 RepID=A0A0C9N0F3_9FUNG|nr:rhoGAP-domain-containing protein [Mucor ambiguus]
MTRGRGRSISQLPPSADDVLLSIEKHFDFVNTTFKYSISDLDYIILMLKARLLAEESYLNSLYKVKRLASSNDGIRPLLHHESQLTFQNAVKLYEGSINDTIESRQRFKDTVKLEIDVLIKQKEIEEQNRKTHKAKLYDANNNYTVFRNRDIIKLQRTYTHKCDDLTSAQHTWQQQQLQQQQAQQQAQQQQTIEGNEFYASGRNSMDSPNPSRLSGDYGNRDIDGASIASYNNSDQHNKKGMAGLISQMRTRAAGNTYLTPLDQNKQITKFAKMKKDITDADNEYREGILVLETLRKKQIKATEEVNRQLKSTIKRKTDTVKTSLVNILHSELDSLQIEMNISRTSFDAAACIDSFKDIQIFNAHYQSQGYCHPTPVRYKNYYLEGDCKEVLFGGSLEGYAIEHNRTVPLLVVKCIDSIEKLGGLQKEGIYRVSGRQTNIEQLKHQFELDEDKVVLDAYDVFTIATVLKMYIRELKRPLFDFNVQTRSSYSKNMPQIQRFQLMETKLSNLSLAHRSTLLYIVRHLAKVNASSQINKMNIPNLALIFTPVIFHDFNQTEEGVGDWSPDDLFEDLILHYEMLFPKAEEVARRNNEPKLQQALNGKSPYSQFSQSNLLYLSNTVLNNTPVTSNNNMLLTQPMAPPPVINSNSGSNSPGGPLVATDQQFNSPYPPKLTTIIGTAPPGNRTSSHQRMASLPQQQQQQQVPQQSAPPYSARPVMTPDQSRIVPPRYQSEGASYQQQQQQPTQQIPPPQQQQDPYMNRSISDNTIMQRGSSMANAEEHSTQSPLPDLKRSSHHFVKGASSTVPPRHDSLRKINARYQSDGEKILEESSTKPALPTPTQQQQQQPEQQQVRPHVTDQYQANLSQNHMLQREGQNLDSFIDYYSPTSGPSEATDKQQ